MSRNHFKYIKQLQCTAKIPRGTRIIYNVQNLILVKTFYIYDRNPMKFSGNTNVFITRGEGMNIIRTEKISRVR